MNSKERLRQLREEGFRVTIHHLRIPALIVRDWQGRTKVIPGTQLYNAYELKMRGLHAFPRGGTTIVEIEFDGELVATGRALVHPKDVYIKVLGRDKALGRAIQQLEQSTAIAEA